LKAHRLLYHSTLGSRVIKKKREDASPPAALSPPPPLRPSSSARALPHPATLPPQERRHPQTLPPRYSSQFKNSYFTEICSGSEAGSYLRLIDVCITCHRWCVAPGPVCGVGPSRGGLGRGGGTPVRQGLGEAVDEREAACRSSDLRTTTWQKCEAVPRRARI